MRCDPRNDGLLSVTKRPLRWGRRSNHADDAKPAQVNHHRLHVGGGESPAAPRLAIRLRFLQFHRWRHDRTGAAPANITLLMDLVAAARQRRRDLVSLQGTGQPLPLRRSGAAIISLRDRLPGLQCNIPAAISKLLVVTAIGCWMVSANAPMLAGQRNASTRRAAKRGDLPPGVHARERRH